MLKQVVSLVVAVIMGVVTVSTVSVSAQDSPWVDTSDRAAVISAYNTEIAKSEPAIGWTGSKAGCDAGTTSQEYRLRMLDRINFYRELAGLPGNVTENATISSDAAASALANSVNNQLSHSIQPDQQCYSAAADNGAQKSNISTATGYAAIDLYMEDANSARTGHRIGLLHPPLAEVGLGDVPADGAGPARNSIYWIHNAFDPNPSMRESEGFVSWPPRGFVPGPLVYSRWSFQLRDANFDAATVSVNSGGGDIPVEVVTRYTSAGVPFSVITFDPVGIDTAPAVDTPYEVTVANVGLNGETKSFTYTVTVIGGEELAESEQAETAGASQPERTPLPEALAQAESLAELRAADGFDAELDEAILGLYSELLDRQPDLGGAKYWLEVRRNGHGVADIREHMKDTDEYAPKAVVELYDQVLRRPPDPAGERYWLGVLRSGRTRAQVEIWMKDGAEYRAVFGVRRALVRLAGE